MSREDILKKTRTFLGKYVRNREVSDDVGIFETGLVNSLFAMQLVMFVEKEFGIAVEDDDLDLANFASINAIADFVERKT